MHNLGIALYSIAWFGGVIATLCLCDPIMVLWAFIFGATIRVLIPDNPKFNAKIKTINNAEELKEFIGKLTGSSDEDEKEQH